MERSNTHLLEIVAARAADADHEQRVLDRAGGAPGSARRPPCACAATRWPGIAAGLRARRDQLARAHAARLGALTRTRAGRRRAERALGRLLAARAVAARATGPGGPWAIPWPIVQCESGGQNLPPNWATASGYYQMLDSTWHGLGGSHAARLPGVQGRAGPRSPPACGPAAPARTTGCAPAWSAELKRGQSPFR